MKARITTWKEGAEQRPVRILIYGSGGAGKSTLISQLMKFKEHEEKAKEGRTGRATTTVVEKFEKTTMRGLKVCLFDTPGFDDMRKSNAEIIAMVENATESKLDLAFYCISLSGPTRVTQGDVRAMKLLTQIFSNQLWKRTVVVLTFANHLEKLIEEDNYKKTIIEITKTVQEVLITAEVSQETVTQLPIVTAGHTDKILQYEAEECRFMGGWENRLYLKALEQVNPAVAPAFFGNRWSWDDTIKALTEGGNEAATGATLGATFGAVAGVAGGPVGIAIGAGVGGTVGLVGGIGAGAVLSQYEKIKSIILIKYEQWKLKKKETQE